MIQEKEGKKKKISQPTENLYKIIIQSKRIGKFKMQNFRKKKTEAKQRLRGYNLCTKIDIWN